MLAYLISSNYCMAISSTFVLAQMCYRSVPFFVSSAESVESCSDILSTCNHGGSYVYFCVLRGPVQAACVCSRRCERWAWRMTCASTRPRRPSCTERCARCPRRRRRRSTRARRTPSPSSSPSTLCSTIARHTTCSQSTASCSITSRHVAVRFRSSFLYTRLNLPLLLRIPLRSHKGVY